MYVRSSDEPKFVPKDYKKIYTNPCSKFKEFGQKWYKGTGVSPKGHPLKGHIRFSGCGNCESENVEVIAAQWSVSYASCDQYWDYEIFCEDCGKYTQRSYADND